MRYPQYASPSTGQQRMLAGLVFATGLFVVGAGAAPAHAGSLEVDVVDADGAPLPNAVVTAMPVNGKPAARAPGTAAIDQIHHRFVPLVTVLQTGTTVTFPNKDNIEHDVYSFSPAKTFELNLYSGVAAHPVVFDKAGLVVLGCNIHDQMIAYVDVVDTPYFAKTDAQGHARIDGLLDESYAVDAWHYRMVDPKTLPHQTVAVQASAPPVRFALKLSPEE